MGTSELRALARRESNGWVAARMFAITHALDGASRAEAARLAGMDRQALRDAVVRYSAECVAEFYDRPLPGRPEWLSEGEQATPRRKPHSKKKRLREALKAAAAAQPGRRLQLWFQGEARIGQKGRTALSLARAASGRAVRQALHLDLPLRCRLPDQRRQFRAGDADRLHRCHEPVPGRLLPEPAAGRPGGARARPSRLAWITSPGGAA